MPACQAPYDNIPRRSWPLFRVRERISEILSELNSPVCHHESSSCMNWRARTTLAICREIEQSELSGQEWAVHCVASDMLLHAATQRPGRRNRLLKICCKRCKLRARNQGKALPFPRPAAVQSSCQIRLRTVISPARQPADPAEKQNGIHHSSSHLPN